jgi:hypothetical protein
MISSPFNTSLVLSSLQTLHAYSTAPLYCLTLASSISLDSNTEDQDSEDEIGFSSHDDVRSHGQIEGLKPLMSP